MLKKLVVLMLLLTLSLSACGKEEQKKLPEGALDFALTEYIGCPEAQLHERTGLSEEGLLQYDKFSYYTADTKEVRGVNLHEYFLVNYPTEDKSMYAVGYFAKMEKNEDSLAKAKLLMEDIDFLYGSEDADTAAVTFGGKSFRSLNQVEGVKNQTYSEYWWVGDNYDLLAGLSFWIREEDILLDIRYQMYELPSGDPASKYYGN